MGQSVACLNGGYDYKFNHGENTKLNIENRTPEKLWEIDESLYAKSALNRYKKDPNNKILLALLREESEMEKRKK
jgi:hypothetical protein